MKSAGLCTPPSSCTTCLCGPRPMLSSPCQAGLPHSLEQGQEAETGEGRGSQETPFAAATRAMREKAARWEPRGHSLTLFKLYIVYKLSVGQSHNKARQYYERIAKEVLIFKKGNIESRQQTH